MSHSTHNLSGISFGKSASKPKYPSEAIVLLKVGGCTRISWSKIYTSMIICEAGSSKNEVDKARCFFYFIIREARDSIRNCVSLILLFMNLPGDGFC